MAEPQVGGLHHVTAVAAEAQRNADFYAGVLGLRFVKRTVNQDDPFTYHLYYGDEIGRPGTAMTFFPFPGVPRGRPGRGQAMATGFSVPPDAIERWAQRLRHHHTASPSQTERFGVPVLQFTDPDGLILELVGDAAPARAPGWPDGPVAAADAIRAFSRVRLASGAPAKTARVLVDLLGYREAAGEAGIWRFVLDGADVADTVELLEDPPPGRAGAGTVHHIAFRVPDDDTQQRLRERLIGHGLAPTPVVERYYFRSVYFREPGGILFEIATDGPGFTTDEAPESLGRSLKLTVAHEPYRAEIESQLPPLSVPGADVPTR